MIDDLKKRTRKILKAAHWHKYGGCRVDKRRFLVQRMTVAAALRMTNHRRRRLMYVNSEEAK